MKKLAASILGICSMVAYVHAQGTFVIDSGANFGNGSSPGASTGGLVWIQTTPGGATNLETSDINLGLMWGATAGSVSTVINMDPGGLNSTSNPNWLASQPTGQGDMTSYGGGAIFDPNGNGYVVPGAGAGTTIFLVLQGWTGNATSFAAASQQAGATAPFSITLAANTSPLQPDIHTMGALVLTPVPEPSILALSGIGAAALMLIRRKK